MRYSVLPAEIFSNLFKRKRSALICSVLLVFAFLFLVQQANAQYVVTNTADTGAGSLRQAIANANAAGDLNNITFNIPGAGTHIITVTTGLAITNPVTIDGYSQPGASANTSANSFNAKILIKIFGATAINGMFIRATGCTISGLSMDEFQTAIQIAGANNQITGNFIGNDPEGTNLNNGNFGNGIVVGSGAGNIIGGTTLATRNVITSNGNAVGAVFAAIQASTPVTIEGNFIGVGINGNSDVTHFDPNKNGIFLNAGSAGSVVGGTTAAQRNVISGNYGTQITVADPATIIGNFIGTNATGTAVDPNADITANKVDGIVVTTTTTGTIVGGISPQSNVISGVSNGVHINGTVATATIQGNYIGSDVSGMNALLTTYGVTVELNSGTVVIGGSTAGQGNVIATNTTCIQLSSPATIRGNLIGTNAAGSAALGANKIGIYVSTTSGSTIGGPLPGSRNIISGSSQYGIQLQEGATIMGNYIGTDINGAIAIPNLYGIYVLADVAGFPIGGDRPGEGNVISGNTDYGIVDLGGSNITGNKIGTDATGQLAIGNNIGIVSGAASTIGSLISGAANIISGNTSGVFSSASTSIVGNYIGTDISGTIPLPNVTGIRGQGVITANVISGNSGNAISGSGTSLTINGNIIGLRAAGDIPLPNGGGITLAMANAGTAVIGGTATTDKNTISANNSSGITINNASTTSTITIEGNYIGTDITGATAYGNTGYGIECHLAPSVTIGGDNAGDMNIISGNLTGGIYADGSPITVLGNHIGTDVNGTGVLGNQNNGIFITSVAGDQTNFGQIGDGSVNGINVIANNTTGITLSSANVERVSIRHNSMFNQTTGILLLGGANNLILTPSITKLTTTTISGTGQSGSTIELFHNTTNDPQGGRTFIGTANVFSGNTWSMTGTFNTTDSYTVTETDDSDNTSQFGSVSPVIGVTAITALTSGGTFAFGTTSSGVPISQIFTISNSGAAPLNVSTVTVSPTTGYSITGFTPSSIAVGSTMTFTVKLLATSSGSFPAVLSINTNDPATPAFTVNLTGLVNGPEIAVYDGPTIASPLLTDGQTTVVDIGTSPMNTNLTQVFTIQNTGNAALAIFSATVSSGVGYSIVGTPTGISPGGTGTFTLVLSGLVPGTFTATVTINNNDADEGVYTFPVTGTITNSAPTVSAIADQTTNEDTPTAAIPFTVGDAETAAAALTATGSSSDQTIIPNANIVIGGTGANRTIQITPAPNQNGVVTITLNVSDGYATKLEFFQLTVIAVNDPPTISVVSNQTTNEDTPTALIPFTVGDIETPAASLIVTGSSSNTTIIPNANIVFGGSGASRTVQITPALNQNGIVTITLGVNDGTVTTTETFQLTINAVNDPPTISVVADQSTNENTATAAIPFTVGDVETPAASLIVTASSANLTLVPNTNIVLAGTGANRTVQIAPALNQNGIVTITLNVNDGTVTTTETFQLTVNAVNNPPTISVVGNQSTNEDTPTAAIPFTVGDVETPAASLIVTASSSNVTIVPNANIVLGGIGANRTVQITPALNQNGIVTITLNVNDGTVTTTETFQLTINAVNDPPTISVVADQVTNEDTPTAAIPFTVGDVETPAASLTVTASSSNITIVPNANIVLGGSGANRTVQITPALNQNGVITITLNVNDGTVTTTETFQLTINAVNDPPTISFVADQSTNEDTPTAAIPFTVGDVETPAASLTVTASSSNITNVPNANIVLGGSGANRTVQITPALNQNGIVTITLNVNDGTVTTTETFQLTINAVNDPPTITAVANQSPNENTATGVLPFTVGDVETPATSLVVTASSNNLTLVPNANIVLGGSGANRTIQITPGLNQSGLAIITLSVNDGTTTTSETFQVAVNFVNTPPTITAVADQITNEDTPTAAIPFTVGDVETPVASLVVTASSSNVTIVPNANIVFGGTGANRTIQITPALNQNGVVTITLNVDDGAIITSETFQLTINPVNDPPTISVVADQITNEDTPTAAIPFTVGDVETPAASLTVTASSSNVTIIPNANIVLGGAGANRTVQITPALNQNGIVTITLNVNDGTFTTTETFQLTINAVNDPPTITPIPNQSPNENTATGVLPFTVGDVETPAASLIVTASSNNLTLIPNANIVLGGSGANRTVQITPGLNQSGLAIITLTVNDGTTTTSETFQVAVNFVNTPPTITVVADQITNEDTPTSVISFTVGDVETPAASLIVTASSSDGTIVPNTNIVLGGTGANRTIQITPALNQNGIVTITLNVNDGTVTTSENFQLTINAVNDPPTITPIANQSPNENTATGVLPFTIGDVETPAASLIVTASSDNLTLVPNANIVLGGSGANRTIQITPALNQSGLAIITLNVNDGATTTSETFQVAVNFVNTPPTISVVADQSINENSATGALSFTVGDIETPAASLIVTASSGNLTLIPNANIVLGGSAANRTIQITPALNQSGVATITLNVNDGTVTTSETFQVSVNFINTSPTITSIADQNINEDTPTNALSFTVGDVETPAASLIVTASSNNTTLIPNANIQLAGTGANRTVQITPALNQNGTASITLNVNDGTLTTSTTFQIIVVPVDDAPTITTIADQVVNENIATGVLTFTIGDIDSPITSLILTTSSDNNALTPNTNVRLGGSGVNRTIQVTPASNQSGASNITIQISDGTLTASTTFKLTVNVGTDIAPVITGQITLITPEETTLSLNFSNLFVTDPDTNYPNGFTLSVQDGTNYTRSGNSITPAKDFNGDLSVPVSVNDGTFNSNVYNLIVTVTPVNDAPLITGQIPLTTPENTALQIAFNDLIVVDPDNSYPTGFTLTINDGTNYTHSGTSITPATSFVGTLTVPVSVNDGAASSNVFNLSIDVIGGTPNITVQITSGGQVNATAIKFTPTEVFTGNEATIIIGNTGAGPLIISAIQFDNPDFSLKGSLPPAIEPGQVVTIIIYFEPSTKGEIAGNMTITSNNSTPEYTILLEGTGVADIEVFNVVTANQNGKNDFLKIKNIEFFPDNKVQIFSRWGDNLFSIAQYDNISRVFKGLTDGGKAVPDGTYYYLIDLKDGKKPKTGFFVLKAN